MKVLITGCKGQVGQELVFLAQVYGCEAIGFDRESFDITVQKTVQTVVKRCAPDVVVNAAAYTAVDKAESDADTAYAVNGTAVEYLAKACADMDIPLVHISTDYVFDGTKTGAYTEEDKPNPLGIYGKSKLAGEEVVRNICQKYYILRTSWVFSVHGNNFVKTMLRLGTAREELSVVVDQQGKPTSAQEIAKIIYLMLLSHKEAWGVYHVAQPDVTTWFDFAENIFSKVRMQSVDLRLKTLNRITTNDYPTPATRPVNSLLDCTKLEKTFDIVIKPWLESLQETVGDVQRSL